jgi:hypothetical protein
MRDPRTQDRVRRRHRALLALQVPIRAFDRRPLPLADVNRILGCKPAYNFGASPTGLGPPRDRSRRYWSPVEISGQRQDRASCG